MNQLLGRPGGSGRYNDDDLASPASAGRPLPAPNAEQAFFHVDVRRSLQQHGHLARTVALSGVALAVLYVLAQVFWFKTWPVYEAESTIYVKTTPSKILESSPGARWPFDTNSYESYIQQQMMNVSRQDVLLSAVHKLDGFQGPGESDESAAQRLVRTLDVTRFGDAYQFTISARAGNPVLAAAIANAVTQAYIEGSARDEHTGDTQRAAILKEEKDRIEAALAADRTEQDTLNRQLGVASVAASVPDHYDEDITQMRMALMKARTDHDAAEAKFASLGAGSGATSSAIDAEADELIANDAGLVSMKTALNARRATLISQMANLTPANPQYKQDEQELTRINTDLEAMMKDLRAKAAGRIQLQLRSDLQRTGGVESQINGQLRSLVGSATSATPKMQRSSDLAGDITRLQARYAAVDEQLHDLILEDSAPGEAYQVTPATPPLTRTKSGVLRNAVMISLGGLAFGLIAAVLAQKLDPHVYIAEDVERTLGFAPMAQLPDFNEVSEGVAEEYVLRLASAVEHGRKQGDLKNCIFTGAASGAGVSTLLSRVRAMLQAMGRSTVLVNASSAQPPAQRSALGASKAGQSLAAPGLAGQGLVPALRLSQSTALLREMAAETEEGDESLVLTDTAPLAVSAETEYLARFVDCAIVVIESGVTTRAQLREAAATLQRLDVGAVGFVLNRVRLATADNTFRQSVEAVEKHVQSVSNAGRRQEKGGLFAVDAPQVREMPKAPAAAVPGAGADLGSARPASVRSTSARSRFEPEVAAAAAAVARFSPPPLARPAAADAVCMPSGMVSPQASEAATRFSVPLAMEAPFAAPDATASIASAEPVSAAEPVAASETDTVAAIPLVGPVPSIMPATADTEAAIAAEPVVETALMPGETSTPPAETPVPAHQPQTAPFEEAARHFAATLPATASDPFYPRPISAPAAANLSSFEAQVPATPAADTEVAAPEMAAMEAETQHRTEPAVADLNATDLNATELEAATLEKAVLEETEIPTEDHDQAEPGHAGIENAELNEAASVQPEPHEPVAAGLNEPAFASRYEIESEPAIAAAPAPAPQPAKPDEDIPWWLSEVVRAPEPVRPPVLWQPARVWSSHPAGEAASIENPAPPVRSVASNLWTGEKSAPISQDLPVSDAGSMQAEDAEAEPESLSSRLSGLRNLLFVLGVKHVAQGEEPVAETAEKAAAFEARGSRSAVDVSGPTYGASPRIVTAQPEFLPPKSVVIEIDKTDAHVGESSTRQDRRAAFDRVDILPSKRGQYKKI